MKQKLLVVLLALMVIFACSSCSVGEQEPSEPGDITGITLTEVGILSWNPYKGANSYRLVIGMNSILHRLLLFSYSPPLKQLYRYISKKSA